MTQVEMPKELTDDEIIRAVVNLSDPSMISDYSVHGKRVLTLSAAGCNEVANLMGGFETTSFEVREDEAEDGYWRATVIVARNTPHGVRAGRLGASTVEKQMEIEDYKTKEKRHVPDPEGYTKVLHVAQRNGIRHSIPTKISTGIVFAYVGRGVTPLDKRRARVMALINEKEKKKAIERHFGTMTMFWAEFKSHFDDVGWIDLTVADFDHAIEGIQQNDDPKNLEEWLRSIYTREKSEEGTSATKGESDA